MRTCYREDFLEWEVRRGEEGDGEGMGLSTGSFVLVITFRRHENPTLCEYIREFRWTVTEVWMEEKRRLPLTGSSSAELDTVCLQCAATWSA